MASFSEATRPIPIMSGAIEEGDVVILEETQTFWLSTGLLLTLVIFNTATLVILSCRAWTKTNKAASLLLKLITLGDLIFGGIPAVFLFIFHFLSPEDLPHTELMCTSFVDSHPLFKTAAVIMGVALARQLHVVTVFGSENARSSLLRQLLPFIFVILLLVLPDMFAYIPNAGGARDSGFVKPHYFCLQSRKMPPLYVSAGIAILLFTCCGLVLVISNCSCTRAKNPKNTVFFTSTSLITDESKLIPADDPNEEETREMTHASMLGRRSTARMICLVIFNALLLIAPLALAMVFYGLFNESLTQTESYLNPLSKWTLLSGFNILAMMCYEKPLAQDNKVVISV